MSDQRGPGPVTIEKIIAAWQRARAGLATDKTLVSDETVVNLGADDPLIATEADVEAVLRRTIRAMLYARLRAREADELATVLQSRKARYEQRRKLLRETLLDMLLALQRQSFQAPEGTASLRAVAASVVITDLDALPNIYVTEEITTRRVPDKKALHADLIEGVVIEGAVLSNSGVTLAFHPARGAGAEAVREEE